MTTTAIDAEEYAAQTGRVVFGGQGLGHLMRLDLSGRTLCGRWNVNSSDAMPSTFVQEPRPCEVCTRVAGESR